MGFLKNMRSCQTIFCCVLFQTYNGQNENNEDYEIPPITPPNLPDPSLLHLVDHETGYHSLCHSLPPNSLIPAYSYQNMDLPAIMVSNMLSQDGHLLSSQLPTVSKIFLLLYLILYTSTFLYHDSKYNEIQFSRGETSISSYSCDKNWIKMFLTMINEDS